MSTTGKQSKSGDIKSVVKDAIIELIGKKRLEKISIEEVVKTAHISRSSFYRYYDSIDDVVREGEEEILDNILKIHRLSLSERLVDAETEPYQSTLARSELILEHADFLAAITGPNGDPQFEYKAKKIMRDYFMKKLKYGDTPKERIIIEYLSSGWYHALNYWVTHYPDIGAEEFVGYMYDSCEVLRVFLGIEKMKTE